MFYSWPGREVLAVPLIMGAAGCCACSRLGFIILTPGTGNWGSLWGHHTQGHELCSPSLQPSLLLDVLGHPPGPAAPCCAWGMSTTFPKKQRWIKGVQAAPGIITLAVTEKILAVPLKQHKSWLGQRPKSEGIMMI